MNTRKAFTLVELLVVIGIIALLISILLPALSRARESANAVKCGSNMRQVGLAIMQYTNDSRGILPMGSIEESSGSSRVYAWDDQIMPYMNARPTTSQLMSNAIRIDLTGTRLETLKCPSDQLVRSTGYGAGQALPRSYSINASKWGTVGGVQRPLGMTDRITAVPFTGTGDSARFDLSGKTFELVRITQARNSAETILLAERPGVTNIIGGGGTAMSVLNRAYHQSVEIGGRPLHAGRKKFNYLFVDGHVASFAPEETVGTRRSLQAGWSDAPDPQGLDGFEATLWRPRGMWSRATDD